MRLIQNQKKYEVSPEREKTACASPNWEVSPTAAQRLSLPHHGTHQGFMLHAQWRNNFHGDLNIPSPLPSPSPRPHSSPKQPCVNGSHGFDKISRSSPSSPRAAQAEHLPTNKVQDEHRPVNKANAYRGQPIQRRCNSRVYDPRLAAKRIRCWITRQPRWSGLPVAQKQAPRRSARQPTPYTFATSCRKCCIAVPARSAIWLGVWIRGTTFGKRPSGWIV